MKKGIWFVHKDNSNTIKLFGSCFNGKEKVYFNNELVSECRTYKKKSKHLFKDSEGNQYEVRLDTTSMMRAEMDCTILKNDEKLKSFSTYYHRNVTGFIVRFIIMIAASVIFSIASVHYGWPKYAFFIFLGVSFILYFVSGGSGFIKIEEK